MEPTILEKLKVVRSGVLDRFKSLSLFVVIKKPDMSIWDFVFAGEGLDHPDNLKVIADIVSNELDKNEIMNISRVVLLDSDDPFAKDFNSAFSVGGGNGYTTIKDAQINNVSIKEAYLFLSK